MDIKKVEAYIKSGILAKPNFDNIKLQTEILREKGYEGISYITKTGKILSILDDGTVRVYSPAGQMMENYPQLLGGEEKNE